MRKFCKFYLRLLHAKAITEKAADYFFFFDVFTDFSNANFGRIRQKAVVLMKVLVPVAWHFPENIFCSAEDFRVVTFFVSFSGVLQDTPH
jgi:hypothetical protein